LNSHEKKPINCIVSVHPPVHLSTSLCAYICGAPRGQIYVRFYVGDFNHYLSWIFRFA